MRSFQFVCVLSLLGFIVPAPATAASLTVCASGCAYADLQPAIDAAQFGDTILLRAGETFTGHYVLRAKAGTGWITIRTSASDTQLPAAGTRLIPSDRSGGNTARSLLPRILGKGGTLKTTPLLKTEPGAHGYRIQFVEFDGAAHLGYETLIMLGDDTDRATAFDLALEHVYIHGDKYKGQKRGISLNSGATAITDSYITDIKAVNADSQAIAAYNGPGPYTITNNHLEAAGENVLFGGADPAVLNLVPADAVFRRNLFTKPLSWRNDILAAPGSVRATAGTGGSLAAATHYFRVVALMTTGTRTVVSGPSSEISAAVGASGKATLTWSSVAGADRYRIYRGTAALAQTAYLDTTGASLSFIYTGTGETAGVPQAVGTKWTVKNIFEVKIGERITLDGNIIENIWPAGQFGYAIVLTPRNSDGKAPWARVKDIVLTNNLVRHAAGVANISAYDDTALSGRTTNVTLRNNVFEDITGEGSAKAFLLQNGPTGVVIDRNTLIHKNTSVVYATGPTHPAAGFNYTGNLSRHGTYGIMGSGTSKGLPTIDVYFPESTITCNVLAGGKASLYPATNSFPTEAEFVGSFADYSAGDYVLNPTSVVGAWRCGGNPVGANYATYLAAQGGAVTTTPDPEPAPEPDPTPAPGNTAPVARAGGPYGGVPAQAVGVNAAGSLDLDGTIASYRWSWGDQVLQRAADLPSSALYGSDWTRAVEATAAGGAALLNTERGAAKRDVALASPSSYVEFQMRAAAGVPYQLWLRGRATGNYYANDSLFVQFSGAATATGAALARIGTSSALAVSIEEGGGAGLSGWGWSDADYGGLAAPVYFAASGLQTIRIQQREDGVLWDQFVLTSAASSTTRPGSTRDDSTILPTSYGTAAGVTASHPYARVGVYPVTVTVTDNDGATGAEATTATIATATGPVADAGGPYAGGVNGALAFDGSGTTIPSGSTASYGWSFGDDIVLRASGFAVSGSAWQRVADSTAADGVAVENPQRGTAKLASALAAPASYVEATFRAAAGVPYRLWLRMRADGDAWANDSIFLQFSGAVTATGAASSRIGTSGALTVTLEEGSGAGLAGWGWADAGYGTLAAPVYFNQDGEQTIRIQQREDGVRIDQIVISTDAFYDGAPGTATGDRTIVAVTAADAAASSVTHAYRRAGVYPVALRVTAGSALSEDRTTATIK